jgi:hypothetical protein
VAANPFVLGFVRGPDLCDRTRELDDLARRAHNGQKRRPSIPQTVWQVIT